MFKFILLYTEVSLCVTSSQFHFHLSAQDSHSAFICLYCVKFHFIHKAMPLHFWNFLFNTLILTTSLILLICWIGHNWPAWTFLSRRLYSARISFSWKHYLMKAFLRSGSSNEVIAVFNRTFPFIWTTSTHSSQHRCRI